MKHGFFERVADGPKISVGALSLLAAAVPGWQVASAVGQLCAMDHSSENFQESCVDLVGADQFDAADDYCVDADWQARMAAEKSSIWRTIFKSCWGGSPTKDDEAAAPEENGMNDRRHASGGTSGGGPGSGGGRGRGGSTPILRKMKSQTSSDSDFELGSHVYPDPTKSDQTTDFEEKLVELKEVVDSAIDARKNYLKWKKKHPLGKMVFKSRSDHKATCRSYDVEIAAICEDLRNLYTERSGKLTLVQQSTESVMKIVKSVRSCEGVYTLGMQVKKETRFLSKRRGEVNTAREANKIFYNVTREALQKFIDNRQAAKNNEQLDEVDGFVSAAPNVTGDSCGEVKSKEQLSAGQLADELRNGLGTLKRQLESIMQRKTQERSIFSSVKNRVLGLFPRWSGSRRPDTAGTPNSSQTKRPSSSNSSRRPKAQLRPQHPKDATQSLANGRPSPKTPKHSIGSPTPQKPNFMKKNSDDGRAC